MRRVSGGSGIFERDVFGIKEVSLTAGVKQLGCARQKTPDSIPKQEEKNFIPRSWPVSTRIASRQVLDFYWNSTVTKT